MNTDTPIVYIIDDDQSVRESLVWLLGSIDLEVLQFESGEQFLAEDISTQPGCAIVDVRMPGISGLEILRHICDKQLHIAVIVVTGHADVAMATRAMKQGAYDFIEKPYNDQQLLDSVQGAIKHSAEFHAQSTQHSEVVQRLNLLSPRETDVLEHIKHGHINKVIADKLSLSVKTIESHRARIMQKMQAHSLAELLRLIYQGKP